MPIGMRLVPLAFGLAVTTAADAAWYAGISGGQSRTSHELVANRESTIINATDLHTDFDAKDNAWKAFGGYRFNEAIAVELNYADLGEHRMLTTMIAGDQALPASVEIRRKISGYGADLVLAAPFGGRFAAFGRAGAFRTQLKASAALEGNINFTNGDTTDRRRHATQHETVLRYGVGGDWWFRPNAALRLEWERYNKVGKAFAIGGSGTTGEADTDAVSLGVMVRF